MKIRALDIIYIALASAGLQLTLRAIAHYWLGISWL